MASKAVVVAQRCRPDLKDGFCPTRVVPKHLGSLHPIVDFFDQRLHQRARRRQSLAAVTRVVHSLPVIGQVSYGIGNRASRIVFRQRMVGVDSLSREPILQRRNYLVSASLPAGPRQEEIPRPSGGRVIVTDDCCRVDVTQRMGKVEDRREVWEMRLLDRPVPGQAVAQERAGRGLEETALALRVPSVARTRANLPCCLSRCAPVASDATFPAGKAVTHPMAAKAKSALFRPDSPLFSDRRTPEAVRDGGLKKTLRGSFAIDKRSSFPAIAARGRLAHSLRPACESDRRRFALRPVLAALPAGEQAIPRPRLPGRPDAGPTRFPPRA